MLPSLIARMTLRLGFAALSTEHLTAKLEMGVVSAVVGVES